MKKLHLFFLTLFAAMAILGPTLLSSARADPPAQPSCSGNSCIAHCCDPADPACTNNADKYPGTDVFKCPQPCNKTNGCDIVANYVNPFIKFLGVALGIAVTVGIIWGGIEYASSAGDPQKSSSGRRHITMAIIALIGYLFIYGAIKFLFPGAK